MQYSDLCNTVPILATFVVHSRVFYIIISSFCNFYSCSTVRSSTTKILRKSKFQNNVTAPSNCDLCSLGERLNRALCRDSCRTGNLNTMNTEVLRRVQYAIEVSLFVK